MALFEKKIRSIFFLEPTRKRKKTREPLDLKVPPPSIQVLGQNAAVDPETIVEDAESKNKKKKARTTFTGRQIFELEKQFELKKYLSSSERSEMAKLLNVTETQVGSITVTVLERLLIIKLNYFDDLNVLNELYSYSHF